MKLLIIVDKLNWAYHSIAKSLIKFNTNKDISFRVEPVKGNVDKIKSIYKKFDAFYVMGFHLYEKITFLPKSKTMVGIHSCHSWDNKKTQPGKVVYPSGDLVSYLSSFKKVNAVSQYLYDVFKKKGLNNIFCTPNGVDSSVFVPRSCAKKNAECNVGYSGTKSHDWRKGITDYIIPASKKAGVKICLAMRGTNSQMPLDEMPSFYQHLDIYICASSSEGFSLSVLEAASCGVPVVSTRITGCTELIRDGENGLFVERDVKDIYEKINMLRNNEKLRNKMSKNIREDVVKKHCWRVKKDKWIDLLSEGTS